MTESIAAASRATSRAAARQLADHYGAQLTLDVEAALHTADERPQQYIDPVSLGGLLVAAATLAWTVYRDLKRQTPAPAPQVINNTIQVELRHTIDLDPAERDRIIDVVVTEILRTAHNEPPDNGAASPEDPHPR
jgi:hypothetical protein